MARFQTPIIALLALAGCGRDEASPDWHQETGYRWRELAVSGARPGFTPMGARTGIRFENTVSDSLLLANRILAQGGGVALGDVDGDGLTDVFLARTEGSNALYRNLGQWRFEDITATAGVGAAERHSSGAAFADTSAGSGPGQLALIEEFITGTRPEPSRDRVLATVMFTDIVVST